MQVKTHAVDKEIVDEMTVKRMEALQSNGWQIAIQIIEIDGNTRYRPDVIVYASNSDNDEQMMPFYFMSDAIYKTQQSAIISTYFHAVPLFGERVMEDVLIYSEDYDSHSYVSLIDALEQNRIETEAYEEMTNSKITLH